MQTFVILRRSGWRTPEELEAAAMRSKQVGEEQMPEDVRWLRSYALAEEDGKVGTVCVYQATSAEAIRSTQSERTFPPTRSSRSRTRSSCARIPSRCKRK